MYRLICLFCLFISTVKANAQKEVAFTIDDVPNTSLFYNEGFKSRLLEEIDSMQLPVAIFINEQLIYSTDSIAKNLNLLNSWIKTKEVTVGNHAFSHAMYSAVGLDSFKTEVLKGEAISRELANRYHKPLIYFRFPYNDLGMNARQHKEAAVFLRSKNYVITPFTIQCEDWMITELYEFYKSHHRMADAARTGRAFIQKTVAYFEYIESLTSQKVGRDVKQIYLMHDNLLEADWLPAIIRALKAKEYSFISLDDAMQDPVYSQKVYYQQKPGISWVYRWMENEEQRNEIMHNGPKVLDFESELKNLK